MDPRSPIDDMPPVDAVRGLLDKAGWPAGEFALQPLAGGGNNRVFCVSVPPSCDPEGAVLDAMAAPLRSRLGLLKAYFRHAGDPRDRLKVEFDFTSFAWQHGLAQVPRPLAHDPQAGLGLYEFIEGRKLEADEVNDNAVSQALTFYRELNQHRGLAAARNLPAGSEACFCLADHLHCVERRLARCTSWHASGQPATDLDREGQAFVEQEVLPCWRQVRARVEMEASKIGLAANEQMAEEERRLSPSDFGFHNALLEASGKLRFVDFEYAGWDDPAKLACDFFCQPALAVPERYWSMFVDELTADLPRPGMQRRRMELLLPVYRVKWLTILLNDFQPAGNERRRFARPGQDQEQRQLNQLASARERLARLVAPPPSPH